MPGGDGTPRSLPVATAALLALFGLGLLAQLALQSSPVFPLDDAYISFRYAENLADGNGMVFNLGERVEGYSNFLHVVLLACSSRLGLTPPLAARLVNGLSVVLAAGLLLFAYPRPAPPLVVRCGALLVLGASGLTSANVLSGLEAPLMAAVLLAAAVAVDLRREGLAVVACVLVSLTRPEGALLALLVLLTDAVVGSRSAPRSARVRPLLVLLAANAAYSAWRLAYFGDLVPGSIRAKQGLPAAELVRASLPYAGRFLALHWPLVVAALAGLTVALARRRSVGRGAPAALVAVVGVALVTGVGDPYQQLLRYLYPALPLLLHLACRAAPEVLAAAPPPRRTLRALLGLALGALLALQLRESVRPIGLARPAPAADRTVASRLAAGLAELVAQDLAPHDFDPSFKGAAQHDMARWFRANAAAGDLLATWEIGTVPYYSGVRVLDLFGLTDRHIARLPARDGNRLDADYVFGREPDYLVLVAGQPCARPPTGYLADPRLQREYELVQMFSRWASWRLVFQRRRQPGPEVLYDFAAHFAPGRAALYGADGEALGGAPDRPPSLRTKSFSGEQPGQRQGRLQEAARRLRQGDAGAIALAAECLAQWKRWIEVGVQTDRARPGLAFDLQVPPGAALELSLGAPADQVGDGVQYDVWALRVGDRPGRLFSTVLEPTRGGGWRPYRVELDAVAGQEVTLVFATSPGPADDPTGDVAGWGDPLLVR